VSVSRYPKYKDSEVEWLGELPEHWEIARVRRLCTIKKRIAGVLGYDVLSITQRGIKIKDTEGNEGQLSLDYSKYQLVDVGDFAMNHMDLLTGWVDISRTAGVTSPDYRVFSVSDPNQSDERYLLYLFQMGYRNKIFFAYGQGSSHLGRWRLPTQEFNELPFPIPPKREQRSIAAFLDGEMAKIDALIAEQQRLIELLKEKRQAIISHAVTKGLNPHALMKPSGVDWLGDVPVHWVVEPLKYSITRIEQGWSPQCSNEPAGENEWGVLKVGCGNKDEFDPTEQKALPPDVAPLPEYEVGAGDILISRGNTLELVGMATLVRDVRPRLLLSDLLYRFRARPGRADSIFLVLSLRSSYTRYQIELVATGSSASMKKIGQGDIRELTIALPPMDEQRVIAEYLTSQTRRLDVLTVEAERAIALLRERRTALISAAVTGKIDVRGLVRAEAA
jgi:type I restriction enzyme, S subunit